MRIPLSWLREHVDVTVAPERLLEALTLCGLEGAGLERSERDVVLDLEVTTNRVDCMNIRGVAREVAVLYDLPLKPLPVDLRESGSSAAEALRVTIEAPDLCPRFVARVLDVTIGSSPAWLAERLEAVGVRPINNVVDLTNYVMIELGQPTHAFDLAKIPGAELRIRWARAGEKLTTLDGVERTLTARCGVVGSPGPGLALAGVMGGASSEVSETTRVVALEAAYWNPLAIRRAAKDAGVKSEASHRFERGADPEAPPVAIARIGHLLQKLGAGTVRPGLIDVHPAPRSRRTIMLRTGRVNAVLGTDVPETRCDTILRGLGFEARAGLVPEVRERGTAYLSPSWRGDVAREVDLIEEIGRHHGLDKIAASIPPARSVEGLRPAQRRERALRDYLVGAGLAEVINLTFVADLKAAILPDARVALANPLSEEQGVLRRSLVVPGLLTSLEANRRHGRRDLALFEIGRVFHPANPLPQEERRLALLLAGVWRSAHWSEKAAAADFFDAKGLLEGLGARLDVHLSLRRGEGVLPPHLHPGRAALVALEGELVGSAGALHPDVASAWGFREEVVVAEISLEALLGRPRPSVRYRGLERFPVVTRDLSVVCDALVPAAEIEGQIRGAAGELLVALSLVDRYAGAPIPEGRVSLTFGLRFGSAERTLTGEEVDAAVERALRALRSAGTEIRGD